MADCDCDAMWQRSLAEVRRVNTFLRQLIQQASVTKSSHAHRVLQRLAGEALVVLEGKQDVMTEVERRREMLKRKYRDG